MLRTRTTSVVQLPALLLAMALLASCGISTRAFLERVDGYAVTRCQISSFENFTSRRRLQLSDGMLNEVGGEGCKLSFYAGGINSALELRPGTLVIFSSPHDYVLLPYAALLGTPSPPLASAAPEENPSAPTVAGDAVDEEAALERLQKLLRERQLEGAQELMSQLRADRSASPRLSDGATALFKQAGLDAYCRGRLDDAVRLWSLALELQPQDAEARRFLERAREVEKQR